MFSHRSSCNVDVKLHVRRQKTHGEVRSLVLSNDVPRSLRRVEDPTTSRHCAITSEMKKDRVTRAPCERRRFANCPLRWQLCRHPSISANAQCNPACHGTTHISIQTLDQQEEMATVLDVLRSRKSAKTQTHCHLVTHFFQPQFVDGCQ